MQTFSTIRPRYTKSGFRFCLLIVSVHLTTALALALSTPVQESQPILPPVEEKTSASDEFVREAIVYQRIGDYTKAITVLTRAIAQDPDTASLLLRRGDVYIHIAVAEQRIIDCTEEITAHPKAATPFLHRGFAYYNTGNYERAIQDYTTALTLRPRYAAAYLGRGLAHVAEGRIKEGLADYERAFALKPGMRPSHRDTLFQAMSGIPSPPPKS